ncbi:Succinylglutamate desuccinylase [Vibrio chagasii]|nr:Succinylglutamate desuccinylase [Vibrio chagasii]CAH7018215.1 Succinylglutamate desuccinylase [Vibrio chagasii]
MNAVLAEPLTTSCNQSSSIDGVLTHKGQEGRNPSCSAASSPTVLADIYQDDINVAIWQRNFDESLVAEINEFIAANPNFSKSVSVSPANAFDKLEFATDGKASKALLENMAELVDMFCCLFELEEVGLRLAVLNKAMCPRFHFDQVPCRLVTTYHGIATQWLENGAVDRSKLGRGSNGQPDSASGLYNDESDIQQMAVGDVALLKGERWSGNENRGLVHRSPVTSPEEPRLLLTIDFG